MINRIYRMKTRILNYLQDRDVNKAIKKFKVKSVKHIFTYTTQKELIALFRLARSLPEHSTCVEIGSYLGASTNYIAMGISGKGTDLYCVDTWQNETMPEGSRDTLSEFLKNTAKFSQIIKVVRKNSLELSDDDLPNKIDFAFIDGDHSYEIVNQDFSFISKALSTNGVIAFHDAIAFKGVSRTIGDALASGEWVLSGIVQNLCWIRKAKFQND